MHAEPAGAALRPVVERVPVGSAVCLFRPDNRATALLDPAAMNAVDACLASGMPQPELPLHHGLREAGFLDAHTARSAVLRSSHRGRSTEAERICVSLPGGPVVALSCSDASLFPLLVGVLQPIACNGREATVSLQVLADDDGYSIWRDGTPVATGLDLATARRATLQSVLLALHGDTPAAVLHASSVVRDDRAVVLAGASGSGKSTLAMSLVSGGACYLADDFTPLAASGRSIGAFPVGASIKHGSLATLASDHPALLSCTEHHVGDRRVRYLPVPLAETEIANSWPVAAMIFPSFQAGAQPEAMRLSPEEALARLLSSGTEIVGAPRSIRPLATLVNETPAWSLSYGTSADGVQLVGKVLR
jgi:hypothetical protein